MDGARDYNAKRNKSEKDKYRMISLIWEHLRNKTKEQRVKKKKRERQIKKQILNYREQNNG